MKCNYPVKQCNGEFTICGRHSAGFRCSEHDASKNFIEKRGMMDTDLYAQAIAKIAEESAEIEKFLNPVNDICGSQGQFDLASRELSLWLTLKTVLEIHKPREREMTPTPTDPFWYKVECSHCIEHETSTEWIFARFPCRTVDLIIKAVMG